MSRCHTEPVFSNVTTIKLRNFGILQEALVKELLEAKSLGICKITTSVNQKPVFRSLDSMLENGRDTMKIDIILTRNDREEEI